MHLTAGISVLVIACPVHWGWRLHSHNDGNRQAAQLNILIRNSDALQSASALDCLVVDKTGTLTRGAPELTDLMPAEGVQAGRLLQLAAKSGTGIGTPAG